MLRTADGRSRRPGRARPATRDRAHPGVRRGGDGLAVGLEAASGEVLVMENAGASGRWRPLAPHQPPLPDRRDPHPDARPGGPRPRPRARSVRALAERLFTPPAPPRRGRGARFQPPRAGACSNAPGSSARASAAAPTTARAHGRTASSSACSPTSTCDSISRMPSLYEHAGGEEALHRLEQLFYDSVLQRSAAAAAIRRRASRSTSST